MIDILAAVAHWCASCIPASVGVAPTVGALSGAAAAAAGISGLGDLASDGEGVPGAPAGAAAGAGAGAGANAPASAASDASTGDTPAVPSEAQTGPAAETSPGQFKSPGWIDNLLGLNPNTSFVQGGMDALGYGQTGIWGRPIAPGEGDLSTLGRALGAAAVSPAVVEVVAVGDLLDNLNHGPELVQVGGEAGEQLNEAPTSPYPAPSGPPSTEPSNAQDAGQPDATGNQPYTPEPSDPYSAPSNSPPTAPSNTQDTGQSDATANQPYNPQDGGHPDATGTQPSNPQDAGQSDATANQPYNPQDGAHPDATVGQPYNPQDGGHPDATVGQPYDPQDGGHSTQRFTRDE